VVEVRNGGGWFLQYDEERQGWVTIDEQAARKKVSQAIQYRRRRSLHSDSPNQMNGNDDQLTNISVMNQQFHVANNSNQTEAPSVSLPSSSPLDGSTHERSSRSGDDDIVSNEQIYEALGIVIDTHGNISVDKNKSTGIR
jgi:hypothetical protein